MGTGENRRVLIVGGGIAGLCAALALRDRGLDAVVFERDPDIAEQQVGAGIGMPYNATRVFRRLGLLDRVEAAGSVHSRFEFRTWDGKLLASWSAPSSESEVGISRRALHRLLIDALGDGMLTPGADCVGFSENDGGVTVSFADGTTERGDVLIGADGLHSTIRAKLGLADEVRYAGYCVWRAVVLGLPAELAPVGFFRMLWGKGRRFSYYHVGDGELYWFGVANAPRGGRDPQGELRRSLLERFAGWEAPVEALIAATPEADIYRTDIFDRKPVPRWGSGRVTLLGDAAHPMTFNLAQGAAQGIEGAMVLARCLGEIKDVSAALRQYEAQRLKRTKGFVNESRYIGAAGRWENRLACAARDAVMRFAFERFVVESEIKKLAIDV